MAKIFDLWYGEPGCGKSRTLIKLIQHVHETTGKKARVYIGDGSLQMYQASGLVIGEDNPDGIIHAMEFAHRDWPFTVCQQMCEGMWPVDNSPTAKFKKLTPQEVADTGIWIIEGIEVMGQYMMGDNKGGLLQRASDGEKLGQEAAISFVDIDEDWSAERKKEAYKFGGSAGSHYGTAQKYLIQNILRTKGFPGIVIWTSHERYDDGERGGAWAKGSTAEKYKLNDKIIGPGVAGKASTNTISREFGNTLHFTIAGKKVQGGIDKATGKTEYKEDREFRIYTTDHFDPDGIVGLKYRAVVRAMHPDKVKPYYVSPANDPGKGLMELYTDLQKANKL